MSYLLHEDLVTRLPITGKYIVRLLNRQADELATSCEKVPDPNVSVVIRSKNNVNQLKLLFADIKAQDFDGKVEVILVDTESSDGTVALAKDFGVKVISITQADFNYPKALNLGFEAAKYEWVLSLVDHSLLTNTQVLRTTTRASKDTTIAGISGILPFPNTNSGWIERANAAVNYPSKVKHPVYYAKKADTGFLAANCSFFKRSSWKQVGGFDESYGAGGEDGALARALFEKGFAITVDPVLSVHHSHGTGILDSIRQLKYWRSLGKPAEFSQKRLAKFRKDLR